MPTWLPTTREVPGLALAFTLGGIALAIAHHVGAGAAYVSDVIVAILLGTVVLNTPIGRMIGLGHPADRDKDRYERGLRFTGKWVLRLAIILMGLKIQANLFRSEQAFICGIIIVFALPSALLLTHFVAGRLSMQREMGDLLSIGTMICGTSAINALAPIIYARRRDQGLAITAVFLFSLVALLAFVPIGSALGLPEDFSGLWAGLAVNDLSSSVAVGSQFGDQGELMAAAAKSLRIMLLGPILIFFSFWRRNPSRAGEPSGTIAQLSKHLPLFIVGYLLLFGVRASGDALFGDAAAWASTLAASAFAVKLLILAVCAGIGLQINVRTMIEVGWKAAVAGGCASLAMAGTSLFMLLAFSRGATVIAIAIGAIVLAGSYGLYVLGQLIEPESARLRRRYESGAPLSLREAISVLELHDADETLTDQVTARILAQLFPAIGELQPLRQSDVIAPINYRRVIYWVSAKGTGSLVGVLWPPDTHTHIHSHNHIGLGKTIEGEIEVIEFNRTSATQLEVASRQPVYAGDTMHFDGRETIHAVRNSGARDAIDIHFYGPALGRSAERFIPLGSVNGSLATGARVSVTIADEELPEVFVAKQAWPQPAPPPPHPEGDADDS